MNPFFTVFLVLTLLGSGSIAMAIVFLQTADVASVKDLQYCWWC